MPVSARAFLDANVIFSAAYAENSTLHRLWALKGVSLVSSAYAIEEARRNLVAAHPANVARLERLVSALEILASPPDLSLPAGLRLESKDHPIMLGAIAGKADYLITADQRHFGHLYGERIEGVLVLRPSQFLERLK